MKLLNFREFPQSFTREETADLLEGGAKILEREEWEQGAYHVDCWNGDDTKVDVLWPESIGNGVQNFRVCTLDTTKKGKHCAMGAMEMYAYETGKWPAINNLSSSLFERSFDAGQHTVKSDDIVGHNDRTGQTKQAVIENMQRLAANIRD